MGYVLRRGAHGWLVPPADVLVGWARGVDHYLPFAGAWVVMAVVAGLAAREGLRGRAVGVVAAWWFVASVAVVRYLTGLKAGGRAPTNVTSLSTFHLLVPSLVLAAWFLDALAAGELPWTRRWRASVRSAVAAAALGLLLVCLARDANAIAFGFRGPVPQKESRQGACRVVKASAAYVRSHGTPASSVFLLTSDLTLGHIGEFYYGLSYSGSTRGEGTNHLLDFGTQVLGRRYAPWALAHAYGVPHFDYYVEFLDPLYRAFLDDHFPGETAFTTDVVDRLVADGAHVSATILEGDREIGRVITFRDEPPVALDSREAARVWDRVFARPGRLIQQPLAGSAYHFGYHWKIPN
jgi:hypothetical protein